MEWHGVNDQAEDDLKLGIETEKTLTTSLSAAQDNLRQATIVLLELQNHTEQQSREALDRDEQSRRDKTVSLWTLFSRSPFLPPTVTYWLHFIHISHFPSLGFHAAVHFFLQFD